MHTQLLTHIIRNPSAPSRQPLQLTPGQILHGELQQIMPNGNGLVRLNGMFVQARLDAPLTVGQQSWFQVQPDVSPITLKVLPVSIPRNETADPNQAALLRHFGLPLDAQSRQLMRFIVQEQLPIDRPLAQQARQVMRTLHSSEQVMRVMQVAVMRELPLTVETVRSIQSFLYEPTSIRSQLEAIMPSLPRAEQVWVKSFINRMHQHASVHQGSSLTTMLHMLGIQYESQLKQWFGSQARPITGNETSLKQRLGSWLQQTWLSTSAREQVEHMLRSITGQQLFLSNDSSPSHTNVLLHIPTLPAFHSVGGYAQLSGPKTPQGEVDAENCRILFDLSLRTLGHTVVDVSIIQRYVHVTVYSDYPGESLLSTYKQPLQSVLNNNEYVLTSMMWKPIQETTSRLRQSIAGTGTEQRNEAVQFYQGVDIRV